MPQYAKPAARYKKKLEACLVTASYPVSTHIYQTSEELNQKQEGDDTGWLDSSGPEQPVAPPLRMSLPRGVASVQHGCPPRGQLSDT